eukprot:913256-Prorocentrum_minimum.AAC.2
MLRHGDAGGQFTDGEQDAGDARGDGGQGGNRPDVVRRETVYGEKIGRCRAFLIEFVTVRRGPKEVRRELCAGLLNEGGGLQHAQTVHRTGGVGPRDEGRRLYVRHEHRGRSADALREHVCFLFVRLP